MEKDKELSPKAIEYLRKMHEEALIRMKILKKQPSVNYEQMKEQAKRIKKTSRRNR